MNWYGCLSLSLVLITGCSPQEEQVPKVTSAEFEEVQRLWPIQGGREQFLGFIQSDRGRDIISRRLRMIFSDRGIKIMKGAGRVEAFRILDSQGGGSHRSIEGYSITSLGKESGEATARKIANSLLDGSSYFLGLDCFISPGVAYRLHAAEGSVTLVICYECNHIAVFVRDEHGSLVHRGGSFFFDPFGRPMGLIQIAKDAFPDDADIRGLKDEERRIVPVERPETVTSEL